MKKKILILTFILSLALCLTFVSSASEYDFISNIDSYTVQPYEYIDCYSSDNYNGYSTCLLHASNVNSTIWYAQPYSFILVVDTLLGTYHNATYIDFKSYCDEHCYDTGDMFLIGWSDNSSDLTETFFNKIYYYSGGKTYDEGITDGIKQAHEFTSDWLADNNILYEPWGATGNLISLDGLLDDNVLPAINNAYNNGYGTGYSSGEDDGKAAGYTEGVNAALTRMESWLTGENILFQSYDKDGDTATLTQYLDGNILPALQQKYNIGKNDGIAIGETTSDSLRQGIFAIFSAPVDMIARILNFELFGINLFYLISGILTLCLAVFIIKKIKG